MSDRLTYSFGPLERRGIAGSVAAGQVAVLAGGALLAVLALDHFPSVGGAMLATLICAGAGTIAFVPVGGRSAQEWLPIASRFVVARITGDDRFLTAEPTAGTPVAERRTSRGDAPPATETSRRRGRRRRRGSADAVAVARGARAGHRVP